jgi:hypothetical protein
MVSDSATSKRRYVMHVSTIEGHSHFVSPLSDKSAEETLRNLLKDTDNIKIEGTSVQGEDFHMWIEPLNEYIERLPSGKDREYFEQELRRPAWSDSKIGRLTYKLLSVFCQW